MSRPLDAGANGRGARANSNSITTDSLTLNSALCQVDVLCTLAALNWYTANSLATRCVDADHEAHALEADFLARLMHQLAALLESEAA
jgi:hypothetical protein